MDPRLIRQLKAVLQARFEKVVRAPLKPSMLALLAQLREADRRPRGRHREAEHPEPPRSRLHSRACKRSHACKSELPPGH